MTGSAFRFEKGVVCRRTRPVSVDDLLQRALGYSRLRAEAIGPRKDEYLDDIRSAIAPYAVDGMLSETIETSGAIFGRHGAGG